MMMAVRDGERPPAMPDTAAMSTAPWGMAAPHRRDVQGAACPF